MKKLFILLIIITLILSSCESKREYGIIKTDPIYAGNVQELVNKYDFILIGRECKTNCVNGIIS